MQEAVLMGLILDNKLMQHLARKAHEPEDRSMEGYTTAWSRSYSLQLPDYLQ